MGIRNVLVFKYKGQEIEMRWFKNGVPEDIYPEILIMVRELFTKLTIHQMKSFLEHVEIAKEIWGCFYDEKGNEIQTRDYENIYDFQGNYLGEKSLPPPPIIFNLQKLDRQNIAEMFNADYILLGGIPGDDYLYFVDFDEETVDCCEKDRTILKTTKFDQLN